MQRIMRQSALYVLAGGVGFLTNLLLYLFLLYVLNLWYVASGVLAFSVAVIVSFFMQKYLAFENRESHISTQLVAFTTLATVNAIANALLLALLVERFSTHKVTAQVLSSILIALWSYFIYKHLIFQTR